MNDCRQRLMVLEGRRSRVLLALVGAGTAMVGLASPAWAGVSLSAAPDPAATVSVGQTRVPSTLRIMNTSTGAQAALNLTVEEITLVAGCGSREIVGPDCPLAAVDPGVLRLSATGFGEGATGCAGAIFTISPVAATSGKYRFAPPAPVVLGPVGSPTAICNVDFTVDVVGTPSIDANPAAPGLQTDEVAFARGVASTGNRGGGFGSGEVTVKPGATPAGAPVTPTATAPASSPPDTPTLTPSAAPHVPASTATAASTAAVTNTIAAADSRPRRHHHRRHRSRRASHHRLAGHVRPA